MIAADVNKINKDEAVTEIKKELNLLSNKLVTSQELHNAKNHLLGSLQLEIANPFSIIEKIKTIHLYGLDENFYNKLFLDIRDLDEATLKKVSNNYLDDNMIEIAVG
jgi:predicted Zn-dependent peptidase